MRDEPACDATIRAQLWRLPARRRDAVHTLWLAAGAEGIGPGWVSILDPLAVPETLDVPAIWKLIGILPRRRRGKRRDAGAPARGVGKLPPRKGVLAAAVSDGTREAQ